MAMALTHPMPQNGRHSIVRQCGGFSMGAVGRVYADAAGLDGRVLSLSAGQQ